MWEYKSVDHNNDWLMHFKYIDKKMINGKWHYIYDRAKGALSGGTTTKRNSDGSVTTTKGNKIFSTTSTTSRIKTQNVPKDQRPSATFKDGQLYLEKKKKKKKGKNFISRFLSKAITTDKQTNTKTTHYNGQPVTKNRRK
nr:MAG TPA: hypothetical protein [Caudoviricetes sp.]